MNLRRLNEQMDEILKQPITLNEISDKVKGKALGKRIAQARSANRKFRNKYPDNQISIDKNLNEEELINPELEQIIIIGSDTWIKDRLKLNGFTEPDFKIETYYGKSRKYDGVIVTASEDDITSLAAYLDDNNYRHYPAFELLDESLNEEEMTLPRYSVIGMNLKRNEKEGIGIVWDKDFDDPREAMRFAQERGKEEPQHVIQLIDTIKDQVLYNSEEKLDESLNEEEFKIKVTTSDGKEKFYKAKDLNDAKVKLSELCIRFNNCELLQGDKVLYKYSGDMYTTVDISLVTEPLYNKLVNILYGTKQSKNRSYEQQQNVLNFLQKIEDRIPLDFGISVDLEDYDCFTVDEINAIKKVVNKHEKDLLDYENKYLSEDYDDIVTQALQDILEADDEAELITSEDVEAQIDSAIKKYIEKHGDEIKLEADYDDELSKEQIIQIFNSKNPTEKFIQIIDEWDWWEMSDSEYEYIIDNLDISDDIRKEYRGEIFNKITDAISYSIPYDHYNTEVAFDIYLQNPNDHAERDTIIWNEQDGEEIITQLDGTIEKLVELQGYNVLDFEEYYQAKKNEKEVQENKFFDDLIEEIENCTNNYGNEIVVLAQAKLLDMANAIVDKKQITIPLDATCGLHNAADGSGSLLSIELEKDLNLTVGKDCEVFYKDGYRYNVDETHGLVYGAWQTDVQIPVSEN